jgi:hypothetical protein
MPSPARRTARRGNDIIGSGVIDMGFSLGLGRDAEDWETGEEHRTVSEGDAARVQTCSDRAGTGPPAPSLRAPDTGERQ